MDNIKIYIYAGIALIFIALGYLIRPVFDPYPVTTGTNTTVTTTTTSNTTAKIDSQKIITEALIKLSPKLKEYYVNEKGEWVAKPDRIVWYKITEKDSVPIYIEVPTFTAEVFDSSFTKDNSVYAFTLVKDSSGNFLYTTKRILDIPWKVIDSDTTLLTKQKFSFTETFTYNQKTKQGLFNFKDFSELQIPVLKQIVTNTVTVTKETFVEKPKGFFDYVKVGIGVGIMPEHESSTDTWKIKWGPQIGIYYVLP